MPVSLPQCSHITCKRGIFYYRRRLPGRGQGEIAISLATRSFREAEHLAGILDGQFRPAWDRVMADETRDQAALTAALRECLRRAVERDTEKRLQRRSGYPIYADWWDHEDAATISAQAAELQSIRASKASVQHGLAHNTPDDLLDEEAERLMASFGLPAHLLDRLRHGMQEASVRFWETAERRTMGLEPVVFDAPTVASATARLSVASSPVSSTAGPPRQAASALIDPFFERRTRIDQATHQVMGQERATLRRFLEVCGDRSPSCYTRSDVGGFLDLLRRLPATYGKAPADRKMPLLDIIARADATDAARVKDKTIKRHLSALSQFFRFAVDSGHLTVAERKELTENHRFKEAGKARGQRDAWEPDELVRLFSSPVWTGSHPTFRSTRGAAVIRDAKFWLPLLALYHGARLEEFADLYGRDIGSDGGIPFIRITEAGGRRLKTDNAERVIPVHPEIVRIGFLDYAAQIAPAPFDPLFPDIEPQGKDRKRGPRITRWFVEYRKAVGVYRAGVGMHAFRHTANTRLRDAISDWQQERHVAYLFGHSQGGGEGRERYDKGPGLAAVAGTLTLLSYPEVEALRL